MNPTLRRHSWCVAVAALACGLSGLVVAQEGTSTPAQTAPIPAAAKPAAKSTAQIDAGEPRATTSGDSAPAAVSAPDASVRTAPAEAPQAAAAPVSGTAPAPKGAAKPASGAAPASRGGAKPASGAGKAAGGADRLDLGTATVTGDREQPKVMYIVPWKKSDIGDLSGKPMNSLLDEALAPVDRDEFKREVAYFDAVKADTSQKGAANAAAKQVEK